MPVNIMRVFVGDYAPTQSDTDTHNVILDGAIWIDTTESFNVIKQYRSGKWTQAVHVTAAQLDIPALTIVGSGTLANIASTQAAINSIRDSFNNLLDALRTAKIMTT